MARDWTVQAITVFVFVWPLQWLDPGRDDHYRGLIGEYLFWLPSSSEFKLG
jgi:hypothetical protein